MNTPINESRGNNIRYDEDFNKIFYLWYNNLCNKILYILIKVQIPIFVCHRSPCVRSASSGQSVWILSTRIRNSATRRSSCWPPNHPWCWTPSCKSTSGWNRSVGCHRLIGRWTCLRRLDTSIRWLIRSRPEDIQSWTAYNIIYGHKSYIRFHNR